MWNNTIFFTEMAGTAFLILVVVASITIAKKLKLSGLTILLFGAVVCSIGLIGAVMIGEIKSGPGFVNPGVALMHSIATNDWKPFPSAIAGELVGAVAAAIVAIAFIKTLSKKYTSEFAYTTEAFAIEKKTPFIKSTFGEVIGTTLFFGLVFLVAATNGNFVGGSAVTVAMVVGFGLFLGIIGSSSFGSLLNGAVGFSLVLVRLGVNNGKGLKFSLINYVQSLVFNLGIGAILGGIAYAAF